MRSLESHISKISPLDTKEATAIDELGLSSLFRELQRLWFALGSRLKLVLKPTNNKYCSAKTNPFWTQIQGSCLIAASSPLCQNGMGWHFQDQLFWLETRAGLAPIALAPSPYNLGAKNGVWKM